MRHTREQLRQLQARSLQGKIQLTQARIIEWYTKFNGNVYVSFSGGKDSTVLLDLVRRIFPDVPAVFSDTGLEYPEIKDFVKTIENVVTVRPKVTFRQVIDEYGYPVIGKEVAKHIFYFRKGSEFAIKAMNGIGDNEAQTRFRKRYVKFKYLTEAPFAIAPHCCDHIKKNALHRYERKTGRKPIIGTMTDESEQRESGWLKTGCNSFESGRSQPMSFWTEQDVLHYLKMTGIPYASRVYGEIIERDGQQSLLDIGDVPLQTTMCDRTGCMFCCFGILHDGTPNRFQRMKLTHPKLYAYCIGGGHYDESGMLKPDNSGLGIGKVLDFIGIPY